MKRELKNEFTERFREKSYILNPLTGRTGIHQKFWTIENIRSEIYELEGDSNGEFIKSGISYTSSITYVKKRINEVELQFENYCKQKVLQGQPKPEEMPRDMHNEKMILDAKLLVFKEELVTLKKWLQKYTDDEQKVSEAKVLCDGPRGHSILREGVLASVDGMVVKPTEDGILIICDKRVIYNGYSTADYFKFIVKPWGVACEKQAVKNKAKAVADGTPLDQLSLGLRRGSNSPWPVMPKHCIKYKLENVKA